MTIASDWAALLERRPSFREALEPLGRIIGAWASLSVDAVAPATITDQRARECWGKGEPLLLAAPPRIPAGLVEPLLHPALDVVSGIEDTREFVEAWDRGDVGPSALLPASGRAGAIEVQERCHLTSSAVAFLSVAGLRPFLSAYFAPWRELHGGSVWEGSSCPCCGAPPGFADLLEDGRRQLACHLCDTRWIFSRLICPFCGNRTTADLARLIAEGADEGYAVNACRACRGYVKEVDRRARWNAGPALVEDWGTPHLDLIAHRRQYWRPIPTLIQLAAGPA